MVELWAGAGTAAWLGILTSISPCPLATNIAAVSYIGRHFGRTRSVVAAGLLYALGRTLAYVLLGTLLIQGLLAAHRVSHWLQKWMLVAIGPVLLLTGILLLGWLKLPGTGISIAAGLTERAARLGSFGSAVLGFLFALAFCPVSAALFFGALLPVAIDLRSGFLLPAAYGIGTAIPVLIVAGALAAGTNQVARAYQKATEIERWARRITGAVFVGIGLWFSIRYSLAFLWR